MTVYEDDKEEREIRAHRSETFYSDMRLCTETYQQPDKFTKSIRYKSTVLLSISSRHIKI